MHRVNPASPRSALFIRYFRAFLLVILVPILVFSLLLFFQMSGQTERETAARLQSTADALQERLDTLLIQLEGEISRFSLELERNDLITLPLNTEQKMLRLAQLRKRLESSASTNPAIGTIGVYFGADERAMTQRGYYPRGVNLDWEPIDMLLAAQSMNGFHVSRNSEGQLRLVVAKCIPLRLDRSRDFVYSTLDTAEIGSYLQFGWPRAVGYIIDQEGRALISSEGNVPHASEPITLETLERTGLVASAASKAMPWRYLVILPKAQARAETDRLLFPLALILLLLCGLGVFFSYLLANSLYRPISELVRIARTQLDALHRRTVEQSGNDIAFLSQTITEIASYSSALEQCLNSGRSRVAGSVFRHLLEGSTLARDEVEEILENYAFPFKDRRFLVFLAEMRNDALMKKWDGWLCRYSLENHIRSALGGREDVEILSIEMEKARVCGVINLPASLAEEELPGRVFFEALQRSMAPDWPHVRICVGGVAEDVMQVSDPYQNAANALSRMGIKPGNPLLYAREAPPAPRPSAPIPLPWLERLINVVLAGDETGASALLHGWYAEVSGQEGVTLARLREMALQIASIVQYSVSRLTAQAEAPGTPTLEQLAALQDGEALLDRLIRYASQAVAAVRQEASAQSNSRMARAVEYVNGHFAEDISLTQVSDLLDVTPQYLSGAFKSEVGRNFTEYVNEKRLQAACDLLLSSKLSVQAIAERVGYNSVQYFARKFKDAFGITPTQYRERPRKT